MKNIKHPLVIDLDGTLTPCDTLWEMLASLLLSSPFKLFKVLPYIFKNRAIFKKQVSLLVNFNPHDLVYNTKLIDYIKMQRQLGRPIVLATAADEIIAKSVYNHFGFFDAYYASNGEINLRGQTKEDLLTGLFGRQQFAYAGNDFSDFKVWSSASEVIVVNASPKLLRRATNLYPRCTIIDPKQSLLLLWFKQMRVYQWAKNILIFIPIVFAHKYFDLELVAQSFLAFLSFGLAASSVYCINDLFDLVPDRLHTKKSNRPLASGLIPIAEGLFGLSVLTLSSFFLASYLSAYFVILILAYYLINIVYTSLIKKLAIIDVIILASLYLLRILAGSLATNIPISLWLLTFSIFIFVSLGFLKRYKELRQLNQTDVAQIPGRFYHTDDLEVVSAMGIASGYISCLVLVLYLRSPEVSGFYHHLEYLWPGCLLVLYWISRTWLLAHRNKIDDDPVLYAIKDMQSWFILIILGILLLLAHSA